MLKAHSSRTTTDVCQTARGAILIFLLLQITSTSLLPIKIASSNPFTDYVQFLPPHVPLPTFWENAEIELVKGTSLEAALRSKLNSLNREFDHLRDSTQSIKWCQQHWWDAETGRLSLDDWKQVDAMYRSRALDLPGTGHAMVPCIDMANHASGEDTVALYDTDANGNGILVLRDGKTLTAGDEVTITYGDEKGACEMLFSYGFIDDSMESARELFLDLDIPDDDPLRQAKKAVAKSAPGFRLFQTGESTGWEGPFVWLLCVNEEDGLKFQLLQSNDGGRELDVSWKGEELRDVSKLDELLRADSLWDVYNLRAVTILQGRVESQLHSLGSAGVQMQIAAEQGPSSLPNLEVAMTLHDLEEELLLQAYEDFEHQVRVSAFFFLNGGVSAKSIMTRNWACLSRRWSSNICDLHRREPVKKTTSANPERKSTIKHVEDLMWHDARYVEFRPVSEACDGNGFFLCD